MAIEAPQIVYEGARWRAGRTSEAGGTLLRRKSIRKIRRWPSSGAISEDSFCVSVGCRSTASQLLAKTVSVNG